MRGETVTAARELPETEEARTMAQHPAFRDRMVVSMQDAFSPENLIEGEAEILVGEPALLFFSGRQPREREGVPALFSNTGEGAFFRISHESQTGQKDQFSLRDSHLDQTLEEGGATRVTVLSPGWHWMLLPLRDNGAGGLETVSFSTPKLRTATFCLKRGHRGWPGMERPAP